MKRLGFEGSRSRVIPLIMAGAAGAAALTGCGGSEGQAKETVTVSVPAPANSSTAPVDDPCQWSLGNRRPLEVVDSKTMVTIDSRCTKPAADPTGIYTVPRQEEGKELRGLDGEPVRLASGTRVVALCVEKGERIQNDDQVGEEWWVRFTPPVPLKEQAPALVPSVHAGFPPHEVEPGPPQPGNLAVC